MSTGEKLPQGDQDPQGHQDQAVGGQEEKEPEGSSTGKKKIQKRNVHCVYIVSILCPSIHPSIHPYRVVYFLTL